jgi:hypothetical protein
MIAMIVLILLCVILCVYLTGLRVLEGMRKVLRRKREKWMTDDARRKRLFVG